MLRHSVRLAALPLACVLSAPAWAQGVKTLSKPEAEFAEPFTALDGVRELRDGRVIVNDPRDKIVQIVDFKGGSAQKIGREGSGPGEYALPLRLFALPGDTTAIFDPLNQRHLLIAPDGKPGDFVTIGGGDGGGPAGGLGRTVSHADGRGRFYMASSPFTMGPDGPKSADSSALIRYDRATKKSDTLAYLKLPRNNAQARGTMGNMTVRVGAANPFSPRDEWAVAPDGRIAVVQADGYRVDWISPTGQRTRGAPIAYAPLKLTEAHKQEWRDGRKNALAMRVMNENGRMSASMGPPPNDAPDPADWPAVLPPFVGGAARVAPNGDLWVRRTGPAGQAPTFDVIDGSGKVTGRVVLPKGARLVGFGNGTVYLTRTDEDDLQYLQRYRL